VKILPSSSAIQSALLAAMTDHDHLAWAVAWAGVGFPAQEELLEQRDKIKQLTVGIHFHQTHPDFLEAFIGAPEVRVVKQPSGVFHPKVFVFWDGPEALNNAERWTAIVGSANFTAGGMNPTPHRPPTPGRRERKARGNTEAAVQLSHEDAGAAAALTSLAQLLDDCAAQGKPIDEDFVAHYRKVYAKRTKDRERLAGTFQKSTPSRGKQRTDGGRPVFETDFLAMPWTEFVTKVRGDREHRFEDRLALLRHARRFFEAPSFSDMSRDRQQMVAGFFHLEKGKTPAPDRPEEKVDWGYFGSMKVAGNFVAVVNENPMGIADALARIPRQGPVTEADFNAFVAAYQEAFKALGRKGSKGLATATRLLAMKRPDTFVCVDNKNRVALCKALQIPQSLTPAGYWHSVVARVREAHWNLEAPPADRIEAELWHGRVALLDAIFYHSG